MMLNNLGQTIDSYELVNPIPNLEDVLAALNKELEDAKTIQAELKDFSLNNGWFVYLDKNLFDCDDADYEKLCKLLKIPVNYLLRLPQSMKKTNIEYWLDFFGDKEVEVVYNKDGLISIQDAISIKTTDVLGIVDDIIPDGKIFKTVNQTNAVQYDIYSENLFYETTRDGYFGGLRVVVKKGLNAPDISPIFLNVNTCAIIECSEYLEKMNLKSLSYKDILRIITERVDWCYKSLEGLFNQFEAIAGETVADPIHRIVHLCNEHAVADRVKAYAVQTYEEGAYLNATFEDLICLFSILGYIDEIKQNSERKLQRLAGYIIARTKTEERCTKCDAILVHE